MTLEELRDNVTYGSKRRELAKGMVDRDLHPEETVPMTQSDMEAAFEAGGFDPDVIGALNGVYDDVIDRKGKPKPWVPRP